MARGSRSMSRVGAFVCVFIPLLHFILVPSLLIAGVVLGVSRLREDVTLATIEGACPRCRTPRTFVVGGRFTEGRAVHCDGCGNGFSVHMKPALPPAAEAAQSIDSLATAGAGATEPPPAII